MLLLAGGPGCKPADSARNSARPALPPRNVTIAEATFRPVERSVVVTGTLTAQERSTLSAKVPGRLQRLSVDLGSPVREGEVVAQIEPRDYELKLEQAEAALMQARTALGMAPRGTNDQVEIEEASLVKQARALLDEATRNRERVQALSTAGIASASEWDAVQAAWKVAATRHEAALEEARTRLAVLAQRRVEFEIARKQLADTGVKAPYDGEVQTRPASPGEFVAAGTPIVTVVKMDPLRLRLEVPERQAAFIRVGQHVVFSVEGEPHPFTGTIARLSPALSEDNRMLVVEADFRREGNLRPGLFARARIIYNPSDQGLSVPASAVITFAGIEKIVLMREGKAVERSVTTGQRGSNWVEIVQGVQAHDRVVLEPAGLRQGQPLVESTAASGAAHPAAGSASR